MIFAVIILALAVVALSVFIIDIYIKLSELDNIHDNLSALQAVMQKFSERNIAADESNARKFHDLSERINALELWQTAERQRRNAKGQFTKRTRDTNPQDSK